MRWPGIYGIPLGFDVQEMADGRFSCAPLDDSFIAAFTSRL